MILNITRARQKMIIEYAEVTGRDVGLLMVREMPASQFDKRVSDAIRRKKAISYRDTTFYPKELYEEDFLV